jgi:hypothetical protein
VLEKLTAIFNLLLLDKKLCTQELLNKFHASPQTLKLMAARTHAAQSPAGKDHVPFGVANLMRLNRNFLQDVFPNSLTTAGNVKLEQVGFKLFNLSDRETPVTPPAATLTGLLHQQK